MTDHDAAHRLVFLHGFTQTHHHCHALAHLIAGRLGGTVHRCFVDLPGHGLSGDDRCPLDDAARRLGAIGGPGTYVGYSMGGRVALAAAAAGDQNIERLVVIGATAGLADPEERGRRIADDEARAARIEEIGVAAFVDEWQAQPMFAGVPATADDREHRLRNTAAGLAASLRTAGTGAQTPVWDRLGAIRIPVLVLAGEHDPKFAAIAERLAAAIPGARRALIPGAGHAAHAEQPAATADLIATWLSQSLSPARGRA